MRVLVIGGGAREHAIVDALITGRADAYCYMPLLNPGIRMAVKGYFLGKFDCSHAVEFAKANNIDVAVIGPEIPLEMGMVDALESKGLPCVGPTKEQAQLETSKVFTRELLKKHNIDVSPKFKVFDKSNVSEVNDFLYEVGGFVVKPDGLTGGKGVRVSGEHINSRKEAIEYCNEVLETHPSAIIEEKLEGEEFSLQTLTDGKSFLHFPPVQDHKRALDGDKGVNTGGVGSYSDANLLLPFLNKEDIDAARKITEKVAAAIKQELGKAYKGVMYGGFIKTACGIKLIEYNARFGDPEAMNVLPILKTSFADICKAVTQGRLGELNVEFEHKATVCKYVVPKGYPDEPMIGKITVPERTKALIYYAAVEERNGGIYTTKSRSVAMVGIADTIEEAERIAEDAASKVEGAVFHRRDIGTKELLQKRKEHVKMLLEAGKHEK